jgi:hypothetical protein
MAGDGVGFVGGCFQAGRMFVTRLLPLSVLLVAFAHGAPSFVTASDTRAGEDAVGGDVLADATGSAAWQRFVDSERPRLPSRSPLGELPSLPVAVDPILATAISSPLALSWDIGAALNPTHFADASTTIDFNQSTPFVRASAAEPIEPVAVPLPPALAAAAVTGVYAALRARKRRSL